MTVRKQRSSHNMMDDMYVVYLASFSCFDLDIRPDRPDSLLMHYAAMH